MGTERRRLCSSLYLRLLLLEKMSSESVSFSLMPIGLDGLVISRGCVASLSASPRRAGGLASAGLLKASKASTVADRSGDTFSTACVMALARLASYVCPWLLPSSISMLRPGPSAFSACSGARDEA